MQYMKVILQVLEGENKKDIKEIQRKINSLLGIKLKIDGLNGRNTQKAISLLSSDKIKLLATHLIVILPNNYVFLEETIVTKEFVDETAPEVNSFISDKENIMNYLDKEEGHLFHHNRSEKSVTSPYGIYKRVFKKAPIWTYFSGLGINFSSYTNHRSSYRNRKRANKLLRKSTKVRAKTRELCWLHYVKHFMNLKVFNILGSKASLTYFSISVNSGMGNSAKLLQKILGTKADGMVGKNTLRLLRELTLSDNELNSLLLNIMADFYRGLIRDDPIAYKQYHKGWYKRLKRLGYRGKKLI